jgi:hypothetical protein
MEIQSKGLDTDYLNVFENCYIHNKDRNETIDFIYDSKGNAGDIFINKDGITCDFITKDNLFPELQNIDKDTTSQNTTDFRGSIIADNIILRDGTNLKEYIDNQIAQVYASIGGTVSTLTSSGTEEDIAPNP